MDKPDCVADDKMNIAFCCVGSVETGILPGMIKNLNLLINYLNFAVEADSDSTIKA